ncbi:MAG: DUF4242 domain-containing protein [Actinomycetota bacterium]|jgi:hypothetical protein
MPKYVIERGLRGAGSLSEDEIAAISQKSNSVLADLGGDVQWQHSYVTDDKLFCVYIAPDAGRVLEHASRGGFPADNVARVVRTIDPTTGGR